VSGAYSYSNGNTTMTLTPNRRFSAGEMVLVVLSDDLVAADSSPIREAGYSYLFWVRSRPANMVFSNVETLSNRTPPDFENTRIYGTAGIDLDADGWLDLASVNEDSSDVRVFMHTGNSTMPYGDDLAPFPTSHQASPNEAADFNNDGKPDFTVAAVTTSSVWVMLGIGDGTFQPPGQEISVGSSPHGIAVLDADGDGDLDIATANTGGGNISLILNNGSGVFGSATSFEGGCGSEYALGAGDMNNDGITDLVVGCIGSQQVVAHLGTGNGTFTAGAAFSAGGNIWMLALGDMNGDGNLDVASANSSSNVGAIIRGNGAGGFLAPTTVAAASNPIATDVGDLDGDGDLDWVLSHFSAATWRTYKNNGTGTMTFDQTISADSAASCAIIMDFDNDHDMDLVLSDELADLIDIERNGNIALMGDFDNDGDVAADDATDFAACYGGPGVPYGAGCFAADFDGDGDVDCEDHTGFEGAWTEAGNAPALEACQAQVPAINEWGLISLALLVAAVGTTILRRRSAPVVSAS